MTFILHFALEKTCFLVNRIYIIWFIPSPSNTLLMLLADGSTLFWRVNFFFQMQVIAPVKHILLQVCADIACRDMLFVNISLFDKNPP